MFDWLTGSAHDLPSGAGLLGILPLLVPRSTAVARALPPH